MAYWYTLPRWRFHEEKEINPEARPERPRPHIRYIGWDFGRGMGGDAIDVEGKVLGDDEAELRTGCDAEQIEAIEWALPRTGYLLALPISFGKTMVALTVLDRWREIYGPWRTLLVSTKSICHHTWTDEIDDWDHLTGKFTYANAAGRNLKAAQAGADITAINFESLEWYLDQVDTGKVELPDVLVVDESSKMKAHNARRVCRLTGLRYTATKKMPSGVNKKTFISFDGFIHRFKRRVLLSATPNPEGYQNLFSQEAIIDQRRRFGDNITSFRDQYCKRDRSGFGYEVIPAYEPMIEEKMKHVMYLPKYDDYLGLPDPIHRAFKVPWDEEERAQYDELEDTLALMIDAAEREEGDTDLTTDEEIEVEAPNGGGAA